MKILTFIKLIFLTSMILVLSACSFKTIYNNIDWVLAGMVDEYVTLSDEQEVNVEKQIAQLMQWHRKTQLSVYARDLKEIKEFTQSELTEANAEFIFNKFLSYWNTIRDRVSPEMATLFLSLNDKQQLELFQRLDEQNEEAEEEFAETTDAEKIEAAGEKMIDNFSDWMGELNEEQEALLNKWPERFKTLHPERVKFRKAWQVALKEVLDNKDIDQKEKRSRLTALVNEPENYQTEAYKEIITYNSKQTRELVLAFDRTVSTEQRTHLAERLDYFSNIFLELAAEE